MTQGNPHDDEAAIEWVARLRDPAFADWYTFTAWLEADRRHNELYERAALADRDLGEVLAAATFLLAPSNDNPAQQPCSTRPTLAVWSAAAMALVVALTAYPLLQHRDIGYEVITAPGEQRNIALADGTRIELNGSTRLTLHRGDTRLASLATGEATFTVVHDAARPFTLHVGVDRIQDVGTVFDVSRTGAVIDIGVAEGAVVYNPRAEAVTLTAGQTLQVAPATGHLVRGTTAPDTIGAWRRGRLVYRGAPIDRIAADVSRYLGVPVAADAVVAKRTFDGVVVLDHNPKRLFARLAPLLDVTARRSEQGWRLTPFTRETH